MSSCNTTGGIRRSNLGRLSRKLREESGQCFTPGLSGIPSERITIILPRAAAYAKKKGRYMVLHRNLLSRTANRRTMSQQDLLGGASNTPRIVLTVCEYGRKATQHHHAA